MPSDLRRRFKKYVQRRRKEETTIIWASQKPVREWQCVECGHVLEQTARPRSCPDCNCVDGDLPVTTRLFIRRAACGWFE